VERKQRKRKADDGNSSGASGLNKSGVGTGDNSSGATPSASSSKSSKKINDYFASKVPGGSPIRNTQGAKSPSQHQAIKSNYPASPQQNLSSSTAGLASAQGVSLEYNANLMHHPRLGSSISVTPTVSGGLGGTSNSVGIGGGGAAVSGSSSNPNALGQHGSSAVGGQQQHHGTITGVGGGGGTGGSGSISKAVQTDLTSVRLAENEAQATADVETRNTKIEDLNRSSEELRHQVASHQRLVEQQKSHITKCIEVIKKLLIEKSTIERKEARQRCMQNRLKLGQFVTQRVGASFQENWTDGYAFQELTRYC
jgi:tousled-like kinase